MSRPKIEVNLPTWFHLEKYSSSKNNHSVCFWYEQLFVRKRCITLLSLKDLPEQVRSNFFDALALIRKKPIVDIHSSPLLQSFFNDHIINEVKKGTTNQSYGIRALSVRDLYNLETRIPHKKRIHARNYFNEVKENSGKGFYSPQYKAESWFNSPLSSVAEISPYTTYINIDLKLTDKLLVEQFTNLLPLLRKQVGIDPIKRKSRRPISFDDLHKYSILPYLDLEIWSQENNTHITKTIMADAIFALSSRGEDDIKTSKKIAHNLMREENISILAELATIEISKRKL